MLWKSGTMICSPRSTCTMSVSSHTLIVVSTSPRMSMALSGLLIIRLPRISGPVLDEKSPVRSSRPVDRPRSGSDSEVNELALIESATSSLCWIVLLTRIGWRRARRSWPVR